MIAPIKPGQGFARLFTRIYDPEIGFPFLIRANEREFVALWGPEDTFDDLGFQRQSLRLTCGCRDEPKLCLDTVGLQVGDGHDACNGSAIRRHQSAARFLDRREFREPDGARVLAWFGVNALACGKGRAT